MNNITIVYNKLQPLHTLLWPGYVFTCLPGIFIGVILKTIRRQTTFNFQEEMRYDYVIRNFVQSRSSYGYDSLLLPRTDLESCLVISW